VLRINSFFKLMTLMLCLHAKCFIMLAKNKINTKNCNNVNFILSFSRLTFMRLIDCFTSTLSFLGYLVVSIVLKIGLDRTCQGFTDLG